MNIRLSLPFFLMALFCLAAGPNGPKAVLAPDNFDFIALLGQPPGDGSPEQKQEIETILALQAHRTPAQIEQCETEESQTVFAFAAPIVGAHFTDKELPVTAALFTEINAQSKAVANAAKVNFHRLQPYLTDHRITPCLPPEKTYSFPSGHSTRGMMWAVVLGEIFPEHHDTLIARGKQFGADRIVAGLHYPSDVAAGQKLGEEIARRVLADPDFRAKVEKAKEECHALQK